VGRARRRQTTEDTEDTQKKQTTENTENTEKNKPRRTRTWEERGADTLVRPYTARLVEVERAVLRATPPVLAAEGSWGVRAAREYVALPA